MQFEMPRKTNPNFEYIYFIEYGNLIGETGENENSEENVFLFY